MLQVMRVALRVGCVVTHARVIPDPSQLNMAGLKDAFRQMGMPVSKPTSYEEDAPLMPVAGAHHVMALDGGPSYTCPMQAVEAHTSMYPMHR